MDGRWRSTGELPWRTWAATRLECAPDSGRAGNVTNVDGLDGLDMGPGRVSWILLDQELKRLVFWCFFWMALGEEFRFEFQRSMPMRASKFECTYSKFDRHVLFLLASLRRGDSSTTLSILQLSSSYEVAGPQDIPKPWFIGKGTTSWSWCFSSLDSAWQAIVMDLPHKQASFRVLSHHFQDSRGFVCFQSRKSRQFRNAICWRGDSSML
jgi:hypothetical protein